MKRTLVALLALGGACSQPSSIMEFDRLAEGQWTMTLRSGARLHTTWDHGPGRQSMWSETHGIGGAGEPWRSLQIVYRDPNAAGLRTLGLVPHIEAVGRGVSEGSVAWDRDTLRWTRTLHQPPGPRLLTDEWAFDGPDAYVSTLSEESGGTRGTLGEWSFSRVETRLPIESAPSDLPDHLAPFANLVNRRWIASDTETRVTIDWVPYVDALRITAHDSRGVALAAVLYYHPADHQLHLFVTMADGAVHRGVLDRVTAGELRCHRLVEARPGGPTSRTMTLGIEAATVRVRITDADGTSPFDRQFRRD